MRWLFIFSLFVSLLTLPTLALADGCRRFTVMGDSGMKFCTECCHGKQCTIQCI